MTIARPSDPVGMDLGEALRAALRTVSRAQPVVAGDDEAGRGPSRHGQPATRNRTATARLVSATVPARALDPIAVFAAAAEAGLEAALWLQPRDGIALVALGRAWSIEAEGPGRFQRAEIAFRGLLSDSAVISGFAHDGPAHDGPAHNGSGRDRFAGDGPAGSRSGNRGPILIGGLGFSGRRPNADDPWAPFGPSSMVVPSLLYSTTAGGCALTGAMLANPDDLGADEAVGAEAVTRPDQETNVEREARALERQWQRLADRARALQPGPNGIVARPVVAPLAFTGSQPSLDVWRRIVGMYAGAVGRGRIDKVVLARRVDLRSPVELDVPNGLRRLAASDPESTVYAFRRDGRTFLGATPERLVRTEGRSFRTVALAGTIRRGADPVEDTALAAELLASGKNREEQRVVVAAIRELLAPMAEGLEVAPRPAIRSLRFAHHLQTEISGTLPSGHGLLSVAALLHPTPAVGGEPRDAALRLIDEHEGFERGWYAGPIGWLGADGDGELCVALRCGIVDRTRATLFAGCGIVADSDPDQEWEESRIKLRAVISALGIPGDDQ